MMLRKIVLLLLLGVSSATMAQSVDQFLVTIEPDTIANAPAIHSYTWGQDSTGRWLIVGGRIDGLHQRQPFAAFLEQDNNKNVFVIDPEAGQVWSASLSSLPTDMFDQLQSTNQEFCQVGGYLYVIGGYGFSNTANDHITFPHLTSIDVNGLADAVVNGGTVTSYFRQLTDSTLAVTGGQLGYLDSTFYLAGGHLFNGRYNPMGPTHGPGFVQVYTEAIQTFRIVDGGDTLYLTNRNTTQDVDNLHRRDYNMAPQVFPNGEKGFTMFSGVFQHSVDLPFLNTVDVTAAGHTVKGGFNQYLSQYHSAKIPVYDETGNAMHTLFFGGMSQYTLDQNGNLMEDQDVPFVKTISRVTRFANDSMTEVKLSAEMPTLVGSGAEFIPAHAAPFNEEEILLLNDLPESKTLVGYIYGGIESSAANIFFVNDGTLSQASNVIFRVYIDKSKAEGVQEMEITPEHIFAIKLYPNPVRRRLNLEFFNPNPDDVTAIIYNNNGEKVQEVVRQRLPAGVFVEKVNLSDLPSGRYIMEVGNSVYSARKPFIVQ